MLLMLLVNGAKVSLAADVTTTDIVIKPTTNGTLVSTSVVKYTSDDPQGKYKSGDYKVTLTASPATGYTLINGEQIYIVVQPLVDPASTRSNDPNIAGNLTVTGSGNTFYFDLPQRYHGATVTATFTLKSLKEIHSLSEIVDPYGGYKFAADFSGGVPANDIGTSSNPFRGVLDGNFVEISNGPLFDCINGAVIKNVILNNVTISSGNSNGNAGAICNEAKGASRIYNCGVLATNSTVEKDKDGYDKITSSGSSVTGSNYVGSIVGLLDGSSRVINCFSYADVSGGSYVGGIVGYNNVATTATNLQTMVMNCMFYGEVKGSSIAPIYNGETITNVGENTGVSNFNYFRLESSYIQNTDITKVYNCALGAETRFLQRFEFYRHLLNSNRELAGWWATGTYSKNDMAKWVLEPSQIGTGKPYPILKPAGYYPSVVNIDAENATTQTERNKGGKLGTLTVNIQMGNGAVYNAPTGAKITTSQLTLNITDKDPDHFNFNYYKVQLPYYNDVGTKNYTGNRVVTGWKIVRITGGRKGSYKTGDYATVDDDGIITESAYNFADRHCTNKDLYDTGGSYRVFNQGAYWDVPDGVTAITIEPYWAKCVYLADPNADKVYNQAMGTGYNVPNVGGGQIYTNGNSYPIAGENQMVFTDKGKAIATSNSGLFQGVTTTDHTVYDYAVVLVGNYHFYGSLDADKSKPYTVTSIDLDGDNEPDYSYILRFDSRKAVHPVRVDFINIPGLGMAQKSTGGTGSYNFGIMQPYGWFESTNTSLFRVTQFEYDNNGRGAEPYILQGGVIEQWVSGQNGGVANKTTYFHVGGNVWFKEFHRGTHQDKSLQSKHPPVSVTGGDYDEFYLTGLYTANVTSYGDNAECYINGGRFGTVCGAAMEGIGNANGSGNTGNITWQVQNADIDEFYAGGINAANRKIVEGNITTVVEGGYIKLFCGGPKFGDMNSGKTVKTTANGTIFDTFFGAGYGGNSYSRLAPKNHNNVVNFPHNDTQNPSAGNHSSWNDWLDDHYTQEYNPTYGGVSTQFSYQFLPMSGNLDNVARIFVDFVKFSLATTHNVTSTLTGCTINENFYGGGSFGKVAGPVSSTLINCTVNGSVYGAGFSASLPTVEVDSIGFRTEPYYYKDLGTYRTGVKGKTTTYTWKQNSTMTNPVGIDTDNHILYTKENLDALGTVEGKVTLNIEGSTSVGGNVYGGGQSSDVYGVNSSNVVTSEVEINVKSGSLNDVYGGGEGEKTIVGGDVTVNIGSKTTDGTLSGSATISGDVYGGSALGAVNASSTKNDEGNITEYHPIEGKTSKVNIYGCTSINNVFGGGLGSTTPNIAAQNFGDVTVTMEGGKVNTAIYGGSNENGVLKGKATVTLKGGSVGTVATSGAPNNVVFGGGKGQPTLVEGDVEVNIGASDQNAGGAIVNGSVYGGSALGNVNAKKDGNNIVNSGTESSPKKTNVTLNIGTIKGDVYGGGLGQNDDDAQVESLVFGDVTVELNKADTLCVVQGSIFGCNNLNGSPQGSVLVHVYGTKSGHEKGKPEPLSRETYFAATEEEKEAHRYDLKAVYGGGNKAAYTPVNSLLANSTTNADKIAAAHTNVIIDGCDRSSIWQVYGGGNAASTPGTSVTIKGTYEIGEVFGGGNGANTGEYSATNPNPGANVGYAADNSDGTPGSQYGSGKAQVNINGGLVHSVFGGSNTKGNVREVAVAMLEETKTGGTPNCPFVVDEAYGGGKSAPMDGVAKLQLGCIPGVGQVYGGAMNAPVNNDVVLTVTNGTFNRVFGGNNKGGDINGTITVNIEETGCTPIVIGQLFGAGNQAAYTAPFKENSTTEREDGPTLNIKSFTSIGEVFGGGFGPTAIVTGDTYININEVVGDQASAYSGETMTMNAGQSDAYTVSIPAHTAGEIGTIGNVYGGGYGANIVGKTYVNIGTESEVSYVSGTNHDPKDVAGANITGDVFGGGFGASTNVSDTAFVNVGGVLTTEDPDTHVVTVTGYKDNHATFASNKGIYGGSALGSVAKSQVNLYAGTIPCEVFGGGKGQLAQAAVGTQGQEGYIPEVTAQAATVSTKANVTLYNATVTGAIYGGCNINGTATAAEVNILGGTLGVSTTPKADILFAGGKGQNTITTTAIMNIGKATTGTDQTTTYSGSATIYSNVYGGSALGNVGVSSDNTAIGSGTVNLYQATSVTGDVYGDGMGYVDATDDTKNVKAKMGNSTVYLYDLDLSNTNSNIYGGCNYNGTVYGKATVNLIGGSVVDVYGGGQGELTAFGTAGSVEVNVGTAVNTGSTAVTGDVYGGSALGHVTAPIVNVYSGTVSGSVFGGGKGALGTTNTSATVSGTATINMYGATIKALYGGCNLCGTVNGDTEVNVIGGNVTKSANTDGVFGGGYGQNTSVTGDVTVNIGKYDAEATTKISGSAVITGDVYGGSAEGNVNTADISNTTKTKKTTVHLYAGKVNGNVYGGGLGKKPSSSTATDGIEAHEYGDVLVDLNNHDGLCYVNGSIFGCNNANGSPSGTSEVHIYKTVHLTSGGAVTNAEPTTYELAAVYGGGDQAAYNGNSTKVVIENCDPSIEYVYGGGNAADVTNTYVEINGAFKIETVFGGGNGSGDGNPGANVSGATQVYLKGGNVLEVFGGSNSRGIVANGTNVYVSNEIEGCPLSIEHVYGAGRNAGMRGKANIVLGCQPTTIIEDIYGGAENADIEGDIELTITSGHFKKVFGGNKSGGAIKGSIRLNIEETNNCTAPLIIDQLFGCGNEAPYSVYGYKSDGTARTSMSDGEAAVPTGATQYSDDQWYADPELHIISFTKIGQVFGGGLGEPAKVYGNPQVFINQRPNYQTENATGEGADKHVLGTIGAFDYNDGTTDVSVDGGVYGGGSEADVYGNTTVFIGSKAQVEMHSLPKVSGAYPMRYVEGANINCNVYGGGLKANVSGNTEVVIGADKVKNTTTNTYTYPATTFAGTSETEVAKYKGILITGDVFGAGQGETTNVNSALVSGNGTVVMAGGSVKKSVYGGGQLSQVGGDTYVTVNGGTIGTAKADLPEGVTMGAVYGNVYGGGLGSTNNVRFGLIKGNTNVTIENRTVGEKTITPTILHNIYGGGAYGSVGTYTYESTDANTAITGRTSGGLASVTVTGGTIGVDGKENGMVFGSSRGDVGTDLDKLLAWVYETNVVIGEETNHTGPDIIGSVYGSGENGHVYTDTDVKIHGGTIGIYDPDDVVKENGKVVKDYNNTRGNVYGGGCGEDTYPTTTTVTDAAGNNMAGKYEPTAGIVYGTTKVTMTGGTVKHNIYGAGALGSVGKMATAANGEITFTSGGTTTIEIRGGIVGDDGTHGDGNVFGAARGDSISSQPGIALVKTTNVTISGTTAGTNIWGSVYGGGQTGDVGTYTTSADGTNTYTTTTVGTSTYPTGTCVVTVNGGEIHHNVFGAGKGAANTFTCQKAMVNSTTVTINNGIVDGNVYGGGEIGRVETNTVVEIGDGDGVGTGNPTSAPEIKGNVFGAGAGLETHGYSALVRGNSTVTVEGNAKVRKNVYGGGEKATVGKYWVTGVDYSGLSNVPPIPSELADEAHKGMPYATRDGGICTVTIQGYAQVGPDAGGSKNAGHVFGAGKGVNPHFVSGVSYRIDNNGNEQKFTEQDKYLQFLETLALTSVANVIIDGENAKVKGSVYGGSESGFVQDDAFVTIKNGEIGTTTYGDIYGGGRGLSTFAEGGRVKGGTTVAVDGGTTHGSVYGGGELGLVAGAVLVNINGGTIDKDVYGGGALAHTNTNNWDGTNLTETYLEVGGLIAGTSSVAGYYTKSGDTYSEATGKALADTKYYRKVNTTVNLLGGLINGDAYGGGLGDLAERGTGHSDVPALVYGDVFVTLGNETEDVTKATATAFRTTYATDDNDKSVVNSGRVFGCNNLNGSPKGNVTVTVNRTVTGKDANGNDLVRTVLTRDAKNKVTGATTAKAYEVAAVYGGGNLANYEPVAGKKPMVRLNTCDISIEEVYGGGNAALVPETDVLILGAHEVEIVFGGGNGEDKYTLNGTDWITNHGADVGTEANPGNTNTLIKGGYIHEAYGASNSKGTIYGDVMIDTGTTDAAQAACPVQVEKLVAAGKNADVNGDLKIILGCKDAIKIPIVYGGADNANVNGNVELTITSGHFGQVFGGNNLGGAIRGHIILNIEETSDCEPIKIDELYLGGNQAAYSKFGYYIKTTETEAGTGYGLPGEHAVLTAEGKLWFMPRTSADDKRKPVDTYNQENSTWTVITDEDNYPEYADPVMNLISCTEATEVFGGGYGDGGDMYANPTVNINMIPGSHAVDQLGGAHKLGEIGNVYGGGNLATVVGDATINIGTANEVTVKSMNYNATTKQYTAGTATVEGANITGNVYGGGKLADVGVTHLGTDTDGNTIDVIDARGNTFVNIGASRDAVLDSQNKPTGEYEYHAVAITGAGYEGVKVLGSVFGGGKGEAAEDGVEGAFRCGKAMITGGTNVCIGNGTIGHFDANSKLVSGGFVYGGGEVGRVEENTRVTIGLGDGGTTPASAPVIGGNVFGAGKGEKTHGYSALVRGNTYVTIQGDAKLKESVYGGGEIASVGRYNVANAAYHAAHPEVGIGMPYSLANENSGNCFVVVRGNAEIGPDTPMKMTADGGPDDTGHVFGAGKGVLPYEGYSSVDGSGSWTVTNTPWRIKPDNSKDNYDAATYGDDVEAEYLKYIETLALATQTDVTIEGNAFVKGSVYGGSENGHVQHNTHVTIAGGQIGAGEGMNERYTGWPTETEDITTSWKACAHWTYDPDDAAPWDPYATYKNPADGKYYYDAAYTQTAEGGFHIAKDGHTFYGNVFGGGSGLIPYAPGKWHRAAGSVGGNTQVDITGGHILTSVYGGNEQTDVGTYKKDDNGALVVPVRDGKCTINMTGGTVGVPRTEVDMKNYPLTCYVFGAGKGDPRIFFNTWTNVIETEVNISGSARIYGSTFGGGEDGHVIGNAETTINGAGVIIGTTGTSYVDGNVFGGGRGFTGEAQTAGTVGGNVEVNIENGKILGSVYGGGRLASVGTMFTNPESEFYGQFKEDDDDGTYGHVAINISGGTIGNDAEAGLLSHSTGGNVFGGSMGRLTLLNGDINPLWPKLAQVKTSTIKITGGTIKHSVYGGGELGTVREDAKVTIEDGIIGRDVYGGGYGSDDYKTKTPITVAGYAQTDYTFTPMQWAGLVGGDTYIDISGGQVKKNVYGGGEMASVGVINYTNAVKNENADNGFVLSWPYKVEYIPYLDGKPVGGATHVNVTGGRIGAKKNDTDIDTDNGDVYGAGKGIAGDYNDYVFCANVRSTDVTININSDGVTPNNFEEGGNCISGAVYGGGENGHVMEDTKLTITNGLIGHSIYGGGSGKGTFSKKLLKIGKAANSTNEDDYYTRDIYSITAGKVFGNTEVNVNGGHVVRNVYGGGNMGSVGKGNYAGGADDYSEAGYGEKVSGNLWDGVSEFSKAFLSSGKCIVNITGGTIGYIDESDPSNSMYPWNSTASLPYGNVFGGCRGESAPNITESPRYLYSPEFFVGYANETVVTIEGDNTKILGSVYGGGMDGHLRRDAHVIIKGGEIGIPYNSENQGKVKTTDPNNIQWVARGNVYGAGSGIGKYKYDFDYDNDYDSKTPTGDNTTYHGNPIKEEDYSTSAGSVTRFTKVEVKGGTIHRNVYGGGSLASVGAPKIGQEYDEYRKGDTTEGHGQGKQTLNEVIISGGHIGDADANASSYDANDFHVYGGMVYGGSRGDISLGNRFSTALYTSMSITGDADIKGDVYGGGEAGTVKGDVDVEMTGGKVLHDIYGGGALADTQTSNWNATGGTDGNGDWADATNKSALHKTTVNLTGGTISGNAYGGALGRVASTGVTPIEAYVYGDVTVKLNEGKTADNTGCIVNKVFGCNNLNGTPKGHVQVYVYATQNKDKADIKTKYPKHEGFETTGTPSTYDVAAVYGGGNLSPYNPVDANSTDATAKEAAQTEVYIYGCDLTSIKQVYGGGNAAPAPATYVRVDGVYEIEELFGGGNGKDNYVIDGKWYLNPGANVGYKNYTHLDGTGDGTEAKPYNCVENDNATTKEGRQTAANGYMYGSGVAHIEVFGGTIHASYGGSNEKGNISTMAWSKYEEGGTCDLNVAETYGGGKNSLIDGEIVLDLGCTTYMPTIFGGSKNADVNSDIVLNVTNGKYDQVFGGNNTSGKINGSITVNIKEEGCVPIEIGELYLGGYLAPYSIYGYQADGTPLKKGDEGALTTPRKQPRLNVISATSIGTIFGGGYKATVVGDPHVNVNMEQGKVEVSKTLKEGTTDEYIYKDGGNNVYAADEYTIEPVGTQYYAILPIGTIGNIYGGGNEADIIGDTNVEIGTGTQHNDAGEIVTISPARNAAKITGNVFGGGKGVADDFECEKAMVGVVDSGTGSTNVTIGNGTVEGSVYGGGEVGRVEANTNVTIGLAGDETNEPVILGNVFGAGAGVETHGYSALVRGNSTVTIQGKAKVRKNVYGGGEKATVGKYWVTGVYYPAALNPPTPPTGWPNGMPYATRGGGLSTVTIQGHAIIGPEDRDGTETEGQVFGAGKGVGEDIYKSYAYTDKSTMPRRMTTDPGEGKRPAIYDNIGNGFIWEYYPTMTDYFIFLETLALASNTEVTIGEDAVVKASVFGGSESGFVQDHTHVTIQDNVVIGTATTETYGNVFAGGKGLSTFAEAGRVRGNTKIDFNGGKAFGSVYGGGKLGDVGTITKNTTDYNYTWTDQDGKANGTNIAKNTGVCTVVITDGEIAGHVFGAGKGLDDTFWCEKAMAYSTNISISNGKVNGNVYGGGQLGRVENDAVVTIGEGTNEPVIKGNVFGAGAGVATHGYSALVRGDATVTVQGKAKVGKSVYGGGETASVGRFKVVNSLPTEPLSGGTCTVKIQGNAEIGSEGEGYVFGACKGVDPDYEHNEGHVINTGESKAFANEAEYLAFLKTLALTSNTHVTIGGNASVNGSVFGGGQRGIALGNVDVNMTGGTVTKDVYGGGALADTNTGNATGYDTSDETISSASTYTTTVNLLGGTIGGEAFGGGLGEKTGVNDATSDVEAIVYGDVLVELNKGVAEDAKGCIVDKIFGANNINGTPKGHVTVHVYATQNKDLADIGTKSTVDGVYDVSYVFGGGNAADYVPAAADTKQSTEVIIEGCDLTSIQEVYGGGYGAATPATSILVKGTKIIDNVYGGGYGAGTDNPGANVGYKTKNRSEYGSGKAVVQLMAGTINNVYGGSNTKGDIRDGSSVTNVTNDGGPGCCEKLSVEEIYGGGKSADMYGGAEICLSCMPNDWIGAIYAGAEKADVGNDISLTLTSGKFERVYGGNKSGGKIDGYIEVNIEENPECSTPIIIGELYGGGNEASYEYSNLAKDPDYPSPRVNVRAFTSIGTIYGGGYGKTATVTGNPTVNINVVEGGREYAGDIRDLDDGSKVTLYARSKDGKIGVIGNVFGGGNAAKVIGNTTVNVGTTTEEQMVSLQTTDEQGNVIVVKKPVVGADIRGNVYGGGNQAEVTGSTNVVIGKKTEE